eukprot:SAG31_NODE_1354_length_8661_cov_170.990306_9_plen_656_part_00
MPTILPASRFSAPACLSMTPVVQWVMVLMVPQAVHSAITHAPTPCAEVPNQRIVYLSPSGSDSDGAGSLTQPFRTLVRARSRVREMAQNAGDVCVLLRGGSYTMHETLELTDTDGGRASGSITYASYGLERAVLEGGRLITGWTKEPTTQGDSVVWSAPLASESSAFTPRQMWFGNDRVNETGLVAEGSEFGNAALLSLADTICTSYGYVTNNSALLRAAQTHVNALASDVEFVWRRTRVQWEEDRLRVASWKMLPNRSLAITMQQPGWSMRHRTVSHAQQAAPPSADFPTSILNLRSTLTVPGTGFVSNATQRVYYVARDTDNMSSEPPFWIPRFDGPLLSLRGQRGGSSDPADCLRAPIFVENMTFISLTLRHSSWGWPSGPYGYLPAQSGFYDSGDGLGPVTSAWELKTARNVRIINCAVENVGTGGIAVDEGSDGVSITNSVIHDTSCWGLRLGQVNDSALSELQGRTQNLLVHNNTVRNTGMELRGCSAVMGGYFRRSEISHNTISSAQWSGISIGWGWGAAATPALGANRILNNRVWDTNLACADGGPIYVLGGQGAGQSEMAGNFVGHARHKCSFIYHDEGSTNWWTHHNVVDQPKSQMPSICKGSWSCNEMPGHYGAHNNHLIQICVTSSLSFPKALQFIQLEIASD